MPIRGRCCRRELADDGVAAVGFTFAGLAATSFPLQVPWLPLAAPLAVLATYVLAVRSRVNRRLVGPVRAVDNRLSVDNMEVCYQLITEPSSETSLPTSGITSDEQSTGAESTRRPAYTSSELWQLERERIFNRS